MKTIKESFFLEAEYDKEDTIVFINTENSTGAEYKCENITDLKKALNTYIENYIEIEEIRNKERDER